MTRAGGVRIKPLGILSLYRVRFRARVVQEALAVVGIAVGVALLFASQVASTSLNGSVRQLTSGLVGDSRLQLAARGPAGLPEDLLTAVTRLPGIRSAAPVLEVQANVIGPKGSEPVNFIGADPHFVSLGGPLLRHFSAANLARQHAIALPAPVAQHVGALSLETLNLQLGSSKVQALLGITLQEGDIGALVHSPVALAPLRYAQQLTGMSGRLTRIFVRPRAGHEQEVRAGLVKLAAGHLNVEPADYDAVLFDSAATPTNQSTALFAAISALVAFLFAFNAILLTVPSRRALIADLQIDGYSHRSIVEVLIFDALTLGVAAVIVGLVLGDELSLHLFHANPGYLSFAFAVGSQRIVTFQSIAIAIAGGLLAAFVGVLAPMRDFLSNRPARSSRARKRVPRGAALALILGGVCLVLTSAIIVFAPKAAVLGVVSLTGALLLLLPVTLRGVLFILESVIANLRMKAPFTALTELRSMWPRTVGIAATGAVAVFGSVAIQGAHADLQRGLDRSASDVSSQAQVWAFPPGLSNLLATVPFRAEAIAQIERLPGVRAVGLYRGGFLDYAGRRVWVSAQPRSQPQMVYPHQLVKGSLSLANVRVRQGGWTVISQAVATQHHLQIGSSFTLPSPNPIRLRVAALSTNVGWPPGAIIINAETYAQAWGSTEASAYEIATTPGASPGTLALAVKRVLGPSSGLQVQTAEQRDSRQRAASRQGLSRLSQISTLVLIAAILAMAAAVGNMIWLRRVRLAQLKLDGYDEFAVWRTLLLETTLLVGSGCSIGAVFGLYGQLLGSHAILTTTGFPVVFSFGTVLAVESLALVTAVAVAISAFPGYYAARVRPAVGL
ncbi:MAG: ABC transporter permease [Solirubrobacteraceae bacterium]